MSQRGITLLGILILVLVILGIAAVALGRAGILQRIIPVPEVSEVTDLTRRVVGGDFNVTKDTPGYENFQELIQGCPGGRDCIPSIDNSSFEPIESGNSWLDDSDVVFVLEHKGEVRAYPQKILNRHEIANDVVAESPIVVTFCPLCGSALAFESAIDGQMLEFGVSGFLHNNDLVMYDRQTDSLWQQITGEAIVGELFGKRLTQLPLTGMLWSQFKKEFPAGEVLSRPSSLANYDFYPYGDYESNPNPLFPMQNVDRTIHPKAVVYGVEMNNSFKAYQEEKIESEGTINDKVGGVNLEISYNNGDVTVVREDTGEEIAATRLFWFAWKAFRPETDLY